MKNIESEFDRDFGYPRCFGTFNGFINYKIPDVGWINMENSKRIYDKDYLKIRHGMSVIYGLKKGRKIIVELFSEKEYHIKEKVVKMEIGSDFFFCLTEEGSLYTNSNASESPHVLKFELKSNYKISEFIFPVIQGFPCVNKRVVAMSAGYDFICFLLLSGDIVYLGKSKTGDEKKICVKLNTPEKMKSLSSSLSYCMGISFSGKLFAVYGSYNIITKENEEVFMPAVFDVNKWNNVICNASSFSAIADNGIYFWSDHRVWDSKKYDDGKSVVRKISNLTADQIKQVYSTFSSIIIIPFKEHGSPVSFSLEYNIKPISIHENAIFPISSNNKCAEWSFDNHVFWPSLFRQSILLFCLFLKDFSRNTHKKLPKVLLNLIIKYISE